MTDLPSWSPPGVDTQRANTARVYDYLLGGSHNFLADQDAGRAITAVDPAARVFARANRAFLGRAVRFLAANGITQFLDIGSGIPAERNVHEVARQAAPGARVAYVDVDPVAVAHSRAIVAGQPDTAVLEADLRDPEKILASPEVTRVIDFSQPAGLLLVAVLHFIAAAEDPWRLVGALRDALAPGSYLILGQATCDGRTARNRAFEKMYNRSVATSIHLRSRPEIERFFDGFHVVDPGVVYVSLWRPDSPADVPEDPSRSGNLVGVGRWD
ncbi:MAG: SAM-dependent methyltransferase [Streptosporangiaceae bacterium]